MPGATARCVALGYTDHETAGSAVTWNAEYAFDVTPTHALIRADRQRLSRPGRDRSFRLRWQPGPRARAFAQLRGGPAHTFTPQQSVKISAFQTDIDDLIDYVVTDFDHLRRAEPEHRRSARARRRGLLAATRATCWNARVEAIYQDPRNLEDDTRLLRRAQGKPDAVAQPAGRPGGARVSTCWPPAIARISAFRP